MAGITEVRTSVRPDLRFDGGAHRLNVVLAPHVFNVRPGTPIKPTPLGWDVATDLAEAKRFAVTHGRGGDSIASCTSGTFNTGREQFLTGASIKIADIDTTGYLTFEVAKDGPFYAESPSAIFMSL
jgi:hypothetical protein